MHAWRVERSTKTGHLVHTVEPGRGHAILSPLVTYAFKVLRVSVAVWEHGEDWFPIHIEPNVNDFEMVFGAEGRRADHNTRSFERVIRTRRVLCAQQSGFADLYAPVVVDGRVAAILVTGPFAVARPTSSDVVERWHDLTGRLGHLSDPDFARYLAMTLGTLVLEGNKRRTFERMVSCVVGLMVGEAPAARLVNTWEHARVELETIRFVERTWDEVRDMIDERSARAWGSAMRRYGLGELGLSRVPDAVLAGLTVSRRSGRDPVEEAIERNAFQRSAVELARSFGDAVAGRIGDHGVVFLVSTRGSARRRQQRVRDLGERAASLARRRFGLTLYCGAAFASGSASLDRVFQAALGAAESALVQGSGLVVASSPAAGGAESLYHLRRDLARGIEQRPDALAARFDRYVEVVLSRGGYRMDLVRNQLEVGFERMAESLLDGGALDEKGFARMRDALDRAAGVARTTDDLIGAFRAAISDLSKALQRPVDARHDRSLRGAIEHIQQHYAEPLRLPGIARMAGISPAYFSRLFRKGEGTTFERYVAALRVERAKQLLASTTLAVGRIARLSGFGSLPYFCRAFRQSTGTSALAYRAAAGWGQTVGRSHGRRRPA